MDHPLASYRRTAKLSKAELAKRASTTRQTIHRIESGEQSPSLDLVRRLIEASNRELRADDFLKRAVVAQ